jgi:hypothetical protein
MSILEANEKIGIMVGGGPAPEITPLGNKPGRPE